MRQFKDAVARTIAGFLNHTGGSLFIGITDGGAVCGLDRDYATLHDQDRVGFERHFVGFVRSCFRGVLSAQHIPRAL